MAVQPGFKKFRFWSSEARDGPPTPDNVSCTAAGGGSVWLGCEDGTVVCLGSDLSLQASFQAHQGRLHGLEWTKVTPVPLGEQPWAQALAAAATAAPSLPAPHCQSPLFTPSPSQGKLLSVGQDGEGLRNLTLKAWAVEGLRPGATPAVLASPCRLLPGAKAAPAASGGGEGNLSAVALHCAEWPAVAVAVGLSTGALHTLRADAAKSKVTVPVPAAQLRDSGASGGITALHLVPAGGSGGHSGQPAAAAAGPELHLFAVGSSRLAAFDVKTGRKVGLTRLCAGPGILLSRPGMPLHPVHVGPSYCCRCSSGQPPPFLLLKRTVAFLPDPAAFLPAHSCWRMNAAPLRAAALSTLAASSCWRALKPFISTQVGAEGRGCLIAAGAACLASRSGVSPSHATGDVHLSLPSHPFPSTAPAAVPITCLLLRS